MNVKSPASGAASAGRGWLAAPAASSPPAPRRSTPRRETFRFRGFAIIGGSCSPSLFPGPTRPGFLLVLLPPKCLMVRDDVAVGAASGGRIKLAWRQHANQHLVSDLHH